MPRDPETTSPAQVHGHDVMDLLATAGRPLTPAELHAAIVERFGADARFRTCTASGLTAAGIVEFLRVRGKLDESGGRLTTDRSRKCSHDEDHAHR